MIDLTQSFKGYKKITFKIKENDYVTINGKLYLVKLRIKNNKECLETCRANCVDNKIDFITDNKEKFIASSCDILDIWDFIRIEDKIEELKIRLNKKEKIKYKFYVIQTNKEKEKKLFEWRDEI